MCRIGEFARLGKIGCHPFSPATSAVIGRPGGAGLPGRGDSRRLASADPISMRQKAACWVAGATNRERGGGFPSDGAPPGDCSDGAGV